MNRREYLEMLAATLLPAALRPRGLERDSLIPAPSPDKLDRIGLQLYTVRSEMGKDFERTLARVAEVGYREVEFAGYFDREPKAVRAALDAVGLLAPSAHVPFESLGDQWSKTLEHARAIGHRYLVVPWIPEEQRRTLDGYRRVGEQFNRAGEAAKAAGLQFGYHNHDFEFPPVEGRVPYDVLLESTDAKLVQMELDLYWIRAAGGDPLAYFTRHPGRFALVHVKDMDGTPKHGMVDVGSGVIDFKGIFARREPAGIRHFFVEHDNPASPFDSIRASFDHLRRLEF